MNKQAYELGFKQMWAQLEKQSDTPYRSDPGADAWRDGLMAKDRAARGVDEWGRSVIPMAEPVSPYSPEYREQAMQQQRTEQGDYSDGSAAGRTLDNYPPRPGQPFRGDRAGMGQWMDAANPIARQAVNPLAGAAAASRAKPSPWALPNPFGR